MRTPQEENAALAALREALDALPGTLEERAQELADAALALHDAEDEEALGFVFTDALDAISAALDALGDARKQIEDEERARGMREPHAPSPADNFHGYSVSAATLQAWAAELEALESKPAPIGVHRAHREAERKARLRALLEQHREGARHWTRQQADYEARAEDARCEDPQGDPSYDPCCADTHPEGLWGCGCPECTMLRRNAPADQDPFTGQEYGGLA